MTKNDDGFVVDCTELRALGDQLHDGISGLDEVAMQGPPAPNAGSSSVKVADVLASITRSVAGVISGVESTMRRISATADVYEGADKESEIDLRHAGGGGHGR